jgi:hypothetical protein
MITQEQLDADKAAIEAAQAKLAQDQAEFDKVQPHLSVLAEIGAYIEHLPAEVTEGFAALIAKAKSLF